MHGRYVESSNIAENGLPPNIPAPEYSPSYNVASGHVNVAFDNPTYANPAELRSLGAVKPPLPVRPEDIDFQVHKDANIGFTNPNYETLHGHEDAEPPYTKLSLDKNVQDEPIYETLPGHNIPKPTQEKMDLEPGVTVRGSKA